MNLGVDNPSLWPLAVLVAVPLLLHVLARHRPPVYEFSSTVFIRRIVRQQWRWRRPKDWLLLALRTLLFAALVALFLRPRYYREVAADPASARALVLVVDATASMGAVDGAQTRLAAACAEASAVLAGLRPNDRANVVWLRRQARAEFPEPGVNKAALVEALRRATATSEAGDSGAAMTLAAAHLGEAGGRREVCVISDFQRGPWDAAAPRLPAGIAWSSIAVGGELGNVALTRLHAAPAAPLPGEAVTLACEVRNYSAQPVLATVYCRLGEARQSQELLLAPDAGGTAVFGGSFAEPGEYVVSASLGEDAFAADNARWLPVAVRPKVSVGLYEAEVARGTARHWRRALLALGWAEVAPLAAADLGGDLRCDVLLLAGWNGAPDNRVRDYLQRGGPVIWLPSPDTDAAHLAELSGMAGGWFWQLGQERHRLQLGERRDPLFAIFADGQFGDPTRGSFTARFAGVPPGAAAAGTALLRYEDGVPALARAPASPLVLWNLPVHDEYSNWARQMEFVPLLGELVLQARRQADAVLPECLPGDDVTLHLAPATAMRESTITVAREGEALVPRALTADRQTWVAGPAPRPGVYAWHQGGVLAGQSVVNFPAGESDLRPTTAPAARAGTVLAGGGELAARREGVPLWPWLLVAAGALLFVELAVAGWAAHTAHAGG